MNSFPLSLFNTLRQAATHLAVLPEEVSVEIYLLSPLPFLMQSAEACPRSFCTRSKILAGQAKVDSPFCKMVLILHPERKESGFNTEQFCCISRVRVQPKWKGYKESEKSPRQSRASFFMVHITLHHPGWAPALSLMITQNGFTK